MKLTKEEYIKDPCRLLAIPYWKEKLINLPTNMIVINDKDYIEDDYIEYNDVLYFRLIHKLNYVNQEQINEKYVIKTVDINNQLSEVVETINKCYANIQVTVDLVKKWIQSDVFDNELWVYIEDTNTNQMVALGISELDKSVLEGALEWIQVLPDYQGEGLGQAIVNETLTRMKNKAAFVTVSGEVANMTNPEALYRKCGFIGDNIWHVMTRI